MPVAFRTLIAVAALVLIAGCSTAPRVSSQAMPRVDFNQFETFGWIDRLGTDARDGEETRLSRRFKAATKREMEALGFRYVEDDPDLLVNFFVNGRKEEAVYTRAVRTDSMGYYDYRYGLYTAWPTYRIAVQDVDYAVGTATIDVIDAAESRLVWEGQIKGRLSERTVINPGAVVNEVVADIFTRFPTRNPRKPAAARN